MFLAAVAGFPGDTAYAGHWEEAGNEDAFLAARDELLALGMEDGRIVPFLGGLYAAVRREGHLQQDAYFEPRD